MKQASKIWLIVAAALVLLGALSFVGIMALSHWQFPAFSGAKYTASTVDVKESFQSISLSAKTEDVALLPSPDGRCHVEFYLQEKRKPLAAVQDGTLTVAVQDESRRFDRFVLFSASPKITVYLPQRDYASLALDVSTGSVSVPRDFRFERIDIFSDTGSVSCGASAAGPVRIQSSTGSIRLENASAASLELAASSGSISVRSLTCLGDMSVTVSTGKVSLADVSCQNLVSCGSTGDIRLEDVLAAELISLERSTGDVEFERCDASELSVTTDTGEVSGSLLSEKLFLARSDTGRIDVPETSGGKCRITTETGDITIRIAK